MTHVIHITSAWTLGAGFVLGIVFPFFVRRIGNNTNEAEVGAA